MKIKIKKLIIAAQWCFAILLPFSAIAQKKATTRKTHSFSLAYGYKTDAKWWRTVFQKIEFETPKKTDDALFKYELGFNSKIGVGIETQINDVAKHKSIAHLENYSFNGKSIRVLPYLSYYFIQSGKISCYANIGAGFYSTRYKVIHTYPSDRNWMGGPFPFSNEDVISNKWQTGFDWAAGAGIKYLIRRNVGAFSEIGLNKSVFQVGIFVKTGKKE